MKCITPQVTLALITTFGLFFCIFYMLKWAFPPEIKEQLSVFTQLLGTIWTLQMNFFFGSSSASKSKDDALSDIAKTASTGTGNGTQAATIPAKDVSVVAEGDVTVENSDKSSIIPPIKGENP